jgi:hypothetical protein
MNNRLLLDFYLAIYTRNRANIANVAIPAHLNGSAIRMR